MTQLQPTKFTLKNGKTCTIRTVQLSDAEKMLTYFHQLINNEHFFALTPDDKETQSFTIEKEKEWLTEHQKPGTIAILAEIEGDIAGAIHIDNYSIKRLRHVGVLNISVAEKYRDLGLGSHLIKTILDWAKQEPQLEKVALAVFSSNTRAIHLYKKFGFIEEGRKIKEIKLAPGQYADSILMYQFVK